MTARTVARALAAAAVALGAASADAQLAFFGNDPKLRASADAWAAREQFLTHLLATGTETFDGAAVGSTALALDFGGVTAAQLTGNGTVGAARYNAALGRTYRTGSAEPFTTALAISFASPVRGFGFDAFNLSSQLSLVFTLGDGRTFVWTPEPWGYQGTDADELDPLRERAFFAGFLHHAGIRSVEFRVASDRDLFEVDQLVVGLGPEPAVLATPEPATAGLLLAGLVGVGAAARRRRASR